MTSLYLLACNSVNSQRHSSTYSSATLQNHKGIALPTRQQLFKITKALLYPPVSNSTKSQRQRSTYSSVTQITRTSLYLLVCNSIR
ncbi:hypothetical protein CEXT_361331 [Caerostris extrusa]|uniref:Uncharacterized protein n=1 Tax=Caerostris extrusa TaxID=172846 RepID=A0AAV4SYI5_CAEEX|nr:hypothetical protein CEXT_361331 [Caerostris extrusa]